MANFQFIQVSHDSTGVCWIRFNRPKKYNAVNFQMYDEMIPTLTSANNDPNCKLIVITGNGKYFTSGNDQSNILSPEIRQRKDCFKDFIDLLIEIRKPLIALVNGPAIGMGVTMLGHCDLVIASDTATFSTPFTRLCLCAEGTSSYMFPRIMGYSNAADMLLFNRKVTAQEMLAWGFVSRVIPHEDFEKESKAFIAEISQLSSKSLIEGKSLIRPRELRDKLHAVNLEENRVLRELNMTPEAMDVMMKFLERKSKL